MTKFNIFKMSQVIPSHKYTQSQASHCAKSLLEQLTQNMKKPEIQTKKIMHTMFKMMLFYVQTCNGPMLMLYYPNHDITYPYEGSMFEYQ